MKFIIPVTLCCVVMFCKKISTRFAPEMIFLAIAIYHKVFLLEIWVLGQSAQVHSQFFFCFEFF